MMMIPMMIRCQSPRLLFRLGAAEAAVPANSCVDMIPSCLGHTSANISLQKGLECFPPLMIRVDGAVEAFPRLERSQRRCNRYSRSLRGLPSKKRRTGRPPWITATLKNARKRLPLYVEEQLLGLRQGLPIVWALAPASTLLFFQTGETTGFAR